MKHYQKQAREWLEKNKRKNRFYGEDVQRFAKFLDSQEQEKDWSKEWERCRVAHIELMDRLAEQPQPCSCICHVAKEDIKAYPYRYEQVECEHCTEGKECRCMGIPATVRDATDCPIHNACKQCGMICQSEYCVECQPAKPSECTCTSRNGYVGTEDGLFCGSCGNRVLPQKTKLPIPEDKHQSKPPVKGCYCYCHCEDTENHSYSVEFCKHCLRQIRGER